MLNFIKIFSILFTLAYSINSYALDCSRLDDTDCALTPGCFYDNGECIECTATNFCENGIKMSCNRETGGTHINSETGAGSINGCYMRITDCGPGYYWNNDDCEVCPNGYVCAGTNSSVAYYPDTQDDMTPKIPCEMAGKSTIHDAIYDAAACSFIPDETRFCDNTGCFTLR